MRFQCTDMYGCQCSVVLIYIYLTDDKSPRAIVFIPRSTHAHFLHYTSSPEFSSSQTLRGNALEDDVLLWTSCVFPPLRVQAVLPDPLEG